MTPDLCVWLGTEEDREVRYTAAEEAHRCYACRPAWAMDLAHQDWYCLTDQHRACKYYRKPTRIPSPPDPGPVIAVEDEFGPSLVEPFWPRSLFRVAGLLLVAAVIYIMGARILSALPEPTLASGFDPSATLSPALSADELLAGSTNTFVLPEAMLRDLEQRLLDEQYLMFFRIDGPLTGENSLYAWDSGFGPLSQGDGPRLVLNVGPAPETPAPTIMPEGFMPTSTPPSTGATSGTAKLTP